MAISENNQRAKLSLELQLCETFFIECYDCDAERYIADSIANTASTLHGDGWRVDDDRRAYCPACLAAMKEGETDG